MTSKWSPDTYREAFWFAAEAHKGQTIKGTQLPYIVHVGLVTTELLAALRAEDGCDEEFAVQCALLHDVVEDTAVSEEQLLNRFGERVCAGVMALTKRESLDRSTKMQDSLDRIKAQPREVAMVKLADRIANLLPPPAEWSPEKVRAYHEESFQILRALEHASAYLAARLREKIRNYEQYVR